MVIYVTMIVIFAAMASTMHGTFILHDTSLHTHTLALLPKGKRQEFCFGDLEGRLGVRVRAVMVDVPEATMLMGIAVDSKFRLI